MKSVFAIPAFAPVREQRQHIALARRQLAVGTWPAPGAGAKVAHDAAAGDARAAPASRSGASGRGTVCQCSPGDGGTLGSKSIRCGPAGPVVFFFRTFAKLTHGRPLGVSDVRPPDFPTSNRQMP